MPFELLTAITDQKPKIGQFFNLNNDLNTDSEIHVEPRRLRVTTMITTKIFKNLEEAQKNSTKEQYRVSAVPFLAEDIQKTAKMSNILERIRYLGVQIKDIQKIWKSISLKTEQKKCYDCNSKVTQFHDKVIESQDSSCSCPVCGAADYLLTKKTRNQIESLKNQIQNYKNEYKDAEQISFEKQVQNNPDIEWLISSLTHRREMKF